MATLTELIVSVGANLTGFKEAMTDVDSTLDKLGESAAASLSHFQDVIDGGIGAGIASAIGAVGAMALEAGHSFEEALNVIIDKTGAEGEKLASLQTSFTDVFKGVPESATNVAEAISIISIRLGLGADALDDFTTKTIKLSQVTGEQLQPQIDSITKAFLNWDIAQSDFGDKEELLLKLHQQTGTAVTSLAEQLASVGNIARLAGESFDETAIRLAALNRQGIDGVDAYMALQRAQALLTKSGSDEQISLNDLVFTVQKAIEAHNGLQVAVDLIGARSGPKFFELIRDGKLDVDSLTKAVAESQTSIAKTWEETETFGKKLQDLKNNLESVLAPLGNLAIEAGKSSADWANFFLAAVQGNSKAMAEFIGQANGAADAALRAKYIAQDAAAAADVESAVSLMASNQHQQSLKDVMALEEAAKASKAALGKAAADIAKADANYADFLKTTYEPALLSVEEATNGVQSALQAYTTAELAEANARQARAISPGDVSLQNALAQAEKDAAAVKQTYVEAIKDENTAKAALATVTKTLQAADDAIASAIKSSYIPALIDHEAALNNIATAQANQATAIQAVKDAQANLSTVYGQATKTAIEVKDAEDALDLTKKNLTAATTALTQAHADEKTSLALLSAAAKEVDADERASIETRKLLFSGATDIISALGNYEGDLRAVADASENLALKEIALMAAQQGVDPQALADATNSAKIARDSLTISTKELSDATTVLSANFHVGQDALDLLKQHQDDWSDSMKVAQIAMSDLGIKSAAVLDQMAQKADADYKAIVASSESSDEEILRAHITKLQDRIGADAAAGITVTAGQQLTLARLKQQEADYISNSVTQWATLYNTIDGDVKNVAQSMIHTLFTGSGSFHDEAIKGLQDIGEAVATKLVKPFEDGIASLIAGGITDLLSGKGLGGIVTALENIGTTATSAFKSLSSAASGVNLGGLGGNPLSSIGAPGTGAIGDTLSTGDTLAGVGSPAGALGGVISAGLSSTLGLVTGAVSAISGVIGIFQNMHQETSLNAIELNTRITAIAMEGNWKAGDSETMFAFTKTTSQYTSHLPPMRGALDSINAQMAGVTAALAAQSSAATSAALSSSLDTANGFLIDTIKGMWGALHDDLVGIWAEAQGTNAQLSAIRLDIEQKGGLGGGVTLTSANGGLVASGTVDPNLQLPGLVQFIAGINERIAAGAINQTGDVQSTTDLLTSISGTLKTMAQTAANGFNAAMSGFGNLLIAANQALPRLDNLITNSNQLLKAQQAVNVYLTVQGSVTAQNDLVNTLTTAIASQLRAQGVTA